MVGQGGSLYVTVAEYWQEVQARKLKYSFLIMTYSALFNNVFEAVNLFLIIIVEFSSSPEHRVLARVLPWLAIGDFHRIM